MFTTRVHVQQKIDSIVYLVREQKDSGHGRWLVQEHADRVLELAQLTLKKYSCPEKLVIFNGTWNGRKATFAKQYCIFNSADECLGFRG